VPTISTPLAIRTQKSRVLRSLFVRDLDDRLAGRAPVAGERGGRMGERPHGADDGLKPSVPEPLSEVGQPGAVGVDDEDFGSPVFGLHGGVAWRR
jgi:hypothetical protein